jgi:thiamine transporter
LNLIRVMPAEGSAQVGDRAADRRRYDLRSVFLAVNRQKGEVGFMSRHSSLRILVETAVMVALSAVLSQITLFKMPQGGSVTPGSMVPILLIALRHGPRWGTLAGVVLGLINFATEPYMVHPAQVMLDYPVAFGALGLAGLASGHRSQAAAGALSALALAGRFVAHLISGAIFFGEYAQGQNVWVYSAVYNGSYMLPELVISGILLAILHPALSRAIPVPSRNQVA